MSKKQLKLLLPLSVVLPRKTKKDKVVSMNLNIYRNQPFHEVNQCKIKYKENVLKYISESGQSHIIFDKPVNLTFQLFKPTKRRTDKSNFSAVHLKNALDSIVELGILPDDNDDWIIEEHSFRTIHDKVNPRVEIILTEI
jgi:Holliday junction resolvase RusA-like endonuclease